MLKKEYFTGNVPVKYVMFPVNYAFFKHPSESFCILYREKQLNEKCMRRSNGNEKKGRPILLCTLCINYIMKFLKRYIFFF